MPESAAPRATLVLPFAFLLHLAEEWLGGFVAWTGAVLGNEVSTERFVWINAIAVVAFTGGTIAALRWPCMAWFGVAFAALVGLNGILHILATLAFSTYSPGTVTGLLLYVPLSVVVLRASVIRLSRATVTGYVAAGVVVHGLIAFLAFL